MSDRWQEGWCGHEQRHALLPIRPRRRLCARLAERHGACFRGACLAVGHRNGGGVGPQAAPGEPGSRRHSMAIRGREDAGWPAPAAGGVPRGEEAGQRLGRQARAARAPRRFGGGFRQRRVAGPGRHDPRSFAGSPPGRPRGEARREPFPRAESAGGPGAIRFLSSPRPKGDIQCRT
jgi:hypothetical protein